MAGRGGEKGVVGAVLDGGEAAAADGRDASAGEPVPMPPPKARMVVRGHPATEDTGG